MGIGIVYNFAEEWIIERRRLQQRSDALESSSREIVRTAEDLAAKLSAFASDGIVVKHLIEFALPPKKRANAAEVSSIDTEHARNPKKQLKKRDDGRQTDTLDVTLSQHTAKAMADSFFKFVEQELCVKSWDPHCPKLSVIS